MLKRLFKILFGHKKPGRCVLPAPKIMVVDVSFEFAKVYNIEKFDVVKGQKFTLFTDAAPTPIKWFADNDAALSIIEGDTSADIAATNIGLATILIMDNSLNKLKELTINVVSAIVEPAKDLGLTADTPIVK